MVNFYRLYENKFYFNIDCCDYGLETMDEILEYLKRVSLWWKENYFQIGARKSKSKTVKDLF